MDGEQLLAKVRELIHQGNIRRVIIKNDEGTALLEIPLTLGVAGAVILPNLAGVGAIAALATTSTTTPICDRLLDHRRESPPSRRPDAPG